MVMASAETKHATARARLLVCVTLPHSRKPHELMNEIFAVRAIEGGKILTDSVLAMLQLAEGQATVSLEVGVAVQIGDDASLDETKDGRGFSEDQSETRW